MQQNSFGIFRGVDGRTPKRIPTLQSGQNSPRIPLGFFKNSVRMAKRIPILQSGQNSSRIPSGFFKNSIRSFKRILGADGFD